MANKLYISEFRNGVSPIGSALAQMMPQPAIIDQIVAISGSSAQSAAFNAKTYAVLLSTDTNCCIVFGDDPTADNTKNFLLKATDDPIAFAVQPNQKVACITP